MSDLISRSALYRKIKTECNPYGKPTIDFESGKRVLDIIDNAPTVPLPDFKEGYKQAIIDGKTNFSRQKGEWIMQRHDLDGCFYTCSNCGRMIRVPLFIDDPEDNETLADYPFCHCGADMRETIQHDDCL